MKFLRDIQVANKRILVRVDFNVSLDKDSQALDDFRLRATLPTIEYLISQNAKTILLAHLGRPSLTQNSLASRDLAQPEKLKTQKELDNFSLKPIVDKLQKLIGRSVVLAPDCVGEETKSQAMRMSAGEILMLENLRWHPEEEKNDADFAKKLAGLGEIYVNDAFAVSHRPHASVEAITKFLPSCAGFLLEKELDNLTRARDNPEHPLVVILGGAKISTKIKLIQSFLNKAEDIILGGAIANTVLRAKGIAVGKSFIEEIALLEARNLEITNTKIHLPVDALLAADRESSAGKRVGPVGKAEENEQILDIGPDSVELFSEIIKNAKMIIWNGPMGYFENEAFSSGTLAIAQAIIQSSAFSIMGGGETIAFLEKKNLLDKFSFVSTGGGAMMEFLSGNKLPGIEALK